jgi:hypothetical protein
MKITLISQQAIPDLNGCSQIILTFGVCKQDVASTEVTAFVRVHAGENAFGLFHGAGGDFGLLDELNQAPADVKAALLKIAVSEGVDSNDMEALSEFIYSVENTARKLVPPQCWSAIQNCALLNS